MQPVICQVKNNPPDSYGDCVRACVASVLELEAREVPHFYETGDGELAFELMREFLREHGLIPAYFPVSGEASLQDVLEFMNDHYANVDYLMFCETNAGNHCVVGHNDVIIHDPAWVRSQIIGPHSQGVWIIIILARL